MYHTATGVTTEWLPDFDSLDRVGVVGLCVFIVLALFLEWIVPGRSHRREVDSKERENGFLRETIKEFSEVGRTVEAFMDSVKKQAEAKRDEDT